MWWTDFLVAVLFLTSYEQLFARDSKAHVMLKNKESLLNVLRDFAESKLGHICTTAAKVG